MRLSEAIRLGALLHPQQFEGREYVHDQNGAIVATCALGAAAQAGYPVFVVDRQLDVRAQCPVCGRGTLVRDVIAEHLNDRHHWTREAIANWVALREPAETPVAADHSVDVRATESTA